MRRDLLPFAGGPSGEVGLQAEGRRRRDADRDQEADPRDARRGPEKPARPQREAARHRKIVVACRRGPGGSLGRVKTWSWRGERVGGFRNEAEPRWGKRESSPG